MNPTPSDEQAYALAVMLTSGMPSHVAFSYFLEPEIDAIAAAQYQNLWLKSKNLQKAILKLQGKAWQEMSLEERVKYAVDKHYGEMAYYLYAHNYSELSGAEKTKADTCRAVLEAKLAGMAGKVDPLSKLYDDLLQAAKKQSAPAVFAAPIPASPTPKLS